MKENRIGKINTNNYGSEMEIVEYHSAMDVIVMFDTGNLVRTTYKRFKDGQTRNPYDPTVCEVGFIGEGIHKASKNGKLTKAYITWNSMLNRAYSKKYHDRNPSYKDVTVCKDWWNFQNFADWFYDHYYKVDNEPMCIDKDILVKGNKVYSPETCVFVPPTINNLFVKCNGSRGKLPVGVTFNKGNDKYQSQCANGKGEIDRLGHYDTPEEAFFAYKIHKERVIKDVAEEYKWRIPEILYQALINWKVEIYD